MAIQFQITKLAQLGEIFIPSLCKCVLVIFLLETVRLLNLYIPQCSEVIGFDSSHIEK